MYFFIILSIPSLFYKVIFKCDTKFKKYNLIALARSSSVATAQ